MKVVRKGGLENQNTEGTKQINSKMLDLSLSILIITWRVNRLNTPSERQRLPESIKQTNNNQNKKTLPCAVYFEDISEVSGCRQVESKHGKLCYVNSKHTNDKMAILALYKVNVKQSELSQIDKSIYRVFTRDKKA